MEFVNRENEILRTLESLTDRTAGFFSDKLKKKLFKLGKTILLKLKGAHEDIWME